MANGGGDPRPDDVRRSELDETYALEEDVELEVMELYYVEAEMSYLLEKNREEARAEKGKTGGTCRRVEPQFARPGEGHDGLRARQEPRQVRGQDRSYMVMFRLKQKLNQSYQRLWEFVKKMDLGRKRFGLGLDLER